MPHLVVVPHTHWDREWYQTYEQFRYRLVELVDRLLPLLEGDPGFRHFTLDGQSIVVDDYLEVRPDSRERIEKLIRDGRLLVGPWMVLPDEWLVSGEALIRNLRLGLRRSEALGGAMELGYAPDLFGHVGQLPQIFRGFGFPAAMLWRGVGADIEHTPFEWEAPDGTRLFTVYLPFGYSNGTHLPLDHAALRARLEQEIRRLERFSLVPSVLLMNGSDHVQPQPGLPAALESVAAALPDVSVEIGTLPGFAQRARREASGELPVHRGELRSGLRAPLLPGCASSRMAQKRADFRNDRTLTRYLEPLAAWLGALGGEPGVAVIEHAWRLAIQNHPHDSICGCSIDAVHDEIDARLARVEQIAELHLDRVVEAFGAHVAVPEAGFGPDAGRSLFVWNPNGPGRAQVDSVLEADLPVRRGRIGPFHLRDATGRRVGARAELVEDGTTLMSFDTNGTGAAYILGSLPEDLAGNRVQGLRHRRDGSTLHVDLRLGAGACGFDFEAARAELEPSLADPSIEAVALRAQRVPRVRLRFVDELPGHGVRVYRLAPGPARDGESDLRASDAAGGCVIENRFYRVAVAESGEIELLHKQSGTRVADAIRLVEDGDRGDEYNFDPVPGGVVVERPEKLKQRVLEDPDAECVVVVHARYRVPARLERSRGARTARTVLLPVTLRLRLARELDRLDVEVEVDNTAEDHRLRLHVRAPGAPDRLEVESAFEVAQRTIAPEPDGFGTERPAEFPVGTSPQRSFASLRASSARGQALTVANRGGGEVEAAREADGTCSLALTLLRAVGWLSRGDLALRPGDAGPPLPTPGAQVPGVHRLEFSVRIHEDGDPRRIAEAHGFAYPPLARCGGSPLGAAVPDGARLARVEQPELLVSAIEPDEEGGALVRVLHASDRSGRAALGFALPGAERLEGVDLRGQPDQALEAAFEGLSGHLELRPWQIVNLRIR